MQAIQRLLETPLAPQDGAGGRGADRVQPSAPQRGERDPPPPLLVRQTEKDQFLLLLLLFQRRDPEGKLLRWEEGNGGVCVISLLPGPAAALENERCQNVAKKRSRR